MPLPRFLLPAAALLLLAAAAPAQQVWVVDFALGPGADFADVQSAVDAAADGDIVLVRVGQYPGFALAGKGLTISIAPYAVPTFAPVGITTPVRVSGVPAESRVTLRELSIVGTDTTPDAALVVEGCAGPVWVEGCVVGAQAAAEGPRDGAHVVGSEAVVLERCVLRGAHAGLALFSGGPGGSGLRVASGSVVVHDSAAQGAQGSSQTLGMGPFVGGAGLVVEQGTLFVSGGSASGGVGGPGLGSRFGPCIDPAAGGPGVHLAGPGAELHSVGTTFAGGAGGLLFGSPCPGSVPPPDGAPIQVDGGSATDLGGLPRSLVVASPVREGEPLRAKLLGAPGEFAVLGVSGTPAPLFDPALGAALLVAWPPQLVLAGVVNAQGVAAWSLVLPDFLPPAQGLVLFWQGFFVDPLRGAAAGAGSASVLLDAAL